MVAFVIQGITIPRVLTYIAEPTQASIAEPAGWPPDGGQASELGLGWERRISPSRSSSSISASVGRLRWRRGGFGAPAQVCVSTSETIVTQRDHRVLAGNAALAAGFTALLALWNGALCATFGFVQR